MDQEKQLKVEQYYAKASPYQPAIAILRDIALQTGVSETYKWSLPVYTSEGKNVFGICRFKNHFGIWFFNGVFLKDPKNVLQNAQKEKTQAMRHWKFFTIEDIDKADVKKYMLEAIAIEKKGLRVTPKPKKQLRMPALLQEALSKQVDLKAKYNTLSASKQNEYKEYIHQAKQEKTKLKRLAKILPMIKEGVGLNDKYR